MSTESMTPEGAKVDLATEKQDAWAAILSDPQLTRAVSKLSIHELRLIIGHVRAEDCASVFETCAQICDDKHDYMASRCADAIRALAKEVGQ